MSDEKGMDILPCECGIKICADCFNDIVKAGEVPALVARNHIG
jgi:cellulose synthase-like protein